MWKTVRATLQEKIDNREMASVVCEANRLRVATVLVDHLKGTYAKKQQKK